MNKNETIIPYGYIYKITNKLTNEIYIGQHKLANEPWRKYLGSGKHLTPDIIKFGEENFIKTLECYVHNKIDMSPTELRIMNEYRDKNYKMYNKNFGSPAFPFNDTYNHMDNVRKKEIFDKRSITVNNKNQRIFEEKIEKIGAQNIIDYYNKVGHMQKTREHFNIKEKKQFRQFLTDNGVEINSQNTNGKKRSEAVKKAISSARIKHFEENSEDLLNEDFINECKYCHEPYPTKRNKVTGQLHRVSCEDCRRDKAEGKIEYIILNRQCDNNDCGRTYQASVNKFTQIPVNRYCSEKCGGVKNKYNSQNITKEELYELYVVKKYSIRELCEYYGCGKSAIYGRLQKFAIPTQSNAKLNTTYKNEPSSRN